MDSCEVFVFCVDLCVRMWCVCVCHAFSVAVLFLSRSMAHDNRGYQII